MISTYFQIHVILSEKTWETESHPTQRWFFLSNSILFDKISDAFYAIPGSCWLLFPPLRFWYCIDSSFHSFRALGPPEPPAPPAPSPAFSSTALPAAQASAAIPSALPPVPVEPVPMPSSQSSPSSASDALEKVRSGNLFCQLIYTPSFDPFGVSRCFGLFDWTERRADLSKDNWGLDSAAKPFTLTPELESDWADRWFEILTLSLDFFSGTIPNLRFKAQCMSVKSRTL